MKRMVMAILTLSVALLPTSQIGSARASDESTPLVPVPQALLTGSTSLVTTGKSSKLTIRCTESIADPHLSGHVSGNTNVVGKVQCTAPIGQISARTALYRDGALVNDGGQRNAFLKAYLTANAAAYCYTGTYTGRMTWTVIFPPGFVPAKAQGEVVSKSKYLSCDDGTRPH